MATPMDPGDGGRNPGAPRVGADLQAARFRLGWNLDEVAARLRIRLPFLVAIEDGDIDALPGNAYALGFVRSYADLLGLDADEVARRFREEAAAVNQKTDLVFPVPVPERGVPAGAVVLLGVLLAAGAYIGWYRLSGDGTLPPEVVPPVPERLAPLAQQAEPPPPVAAPTLAQGDASGAPTAVAGSSSTAVPPAAELPPLPSVPPSQAAAMPFPEPRLSAPGSADAAPVPPALDAARIVLRATSDSWIQVRDPKGAVLFNRVLHAGESWPVPARPALLLTTGNAGGTELVVDGVAAAPLGGAGVVRRDVPLDPGTLLAGKPAPVVTPAPMPSPPSATH